MNILSYVCWKVSKKVWDFAYKYESNILLYYSMLAMLKFSPVFNEGLKNDRKTF